jgi:hypothetical protein
LLLHRPQSPSNNPIYKRRRRRIYLIFVEITKRVMEHEVMKPDQYIKEKPSYRNKNFP